MKLRFLIMAFLCFFINLSFSQKVIVFYEDPTLRVVDKPNYFFQREVDISNRIEITDSLFISYLTTVIDNLTLCDTGCCTSHIWPAMIQIIFVRNDYAYDIINMTHGLFPINETGQYLENGCIELNGKIMNFNSDFQEIMDNIVNYKIVNKKVNINSGDFLDSIVVHGNRHLLNPYLPPPPKKTKKRRR